MTMDGSTDDSAQERTLQRGSALGRYLIIEKVGAGAMGVVYAAYDPQLDRKVALKIVREGAFPDESASQGRTRLLREARTMASLSHPNIVAAFDAGVLEEHVFIAMEFVEGLTLRRWLGEKARTAREVLQVFLEAGRGLSAAHAAGLVHRDFKPDNVLIDGRGRVRVTDFGLARPVRGQLGSALAQQATVPFAEQDGSRSEPLCAGASRPAAGTWGTATGAVIGTPAYMAPEQITRRGADHRSDQFSFCVALHEALHGALPFEGETPAAVAFAATMGRLRALPQGSPVPAWIAPILRRGLAVKPEDRYGSLDALLADLSRDRMHARRRWLAAAAVILAAAAGATGYAALATRLRDPAGIVCKGAARRLAGVWDPDRRHVIEAAFLSTGRVYAADAARGVASALDRYASDWEAMHTDACLATRVRGDQPEGVLASRMRCLERRLTELTRLTDLFAKPDAQIVEHAVAAAQSVRGVEGCADIEALSTTIEPPANPQTLKAVEAVRRQMAEAKALLDVGKWDKGLRIATDAVTAARTLEYPPVLAEALDIEGELEGKTMQQPAAERTLYEAVVAAEAGRHEAERARAWTRLVWEVGNVQGRHDEGLRHARIAEAIIGHLGRGQEELRAELHSHRGTIFIEQARYAEAVAELRRSLELRRKIFSPAHRSLAISHGNLAISLNGAGRYEEAFGHFQQSLSIFERAYGQRHPDVGTALLNLGEALAQKGQYREAQAACERALSIHEAVYGAGNVGVVEALDNLSEALLQQGRFEEASRHARRAIAIREKVQSDNPNLIRVLDTLGRALRVGGDVAAARSRFRQALDLAERDLGREHPLVAESLSGLGACAQDRGDLAAALRFHRRALAIGEKAHGSDNLEVAVDLVGIGRALVSSKRHAEALPFLARALTIRRAHPADRAMRAEAAFLLAQANWETGRNREEALRMAEAARVDYSASEGYRRHEAADVVAWVGIKTRQ